MTILVVVGLLVGGFLWVPGAIRRDDQHRQFATCVLHAPLGWDCERHPTGYP